MQKYLNKTYLMLYKLSAAIILTNNISLKILINHNFIHKCLNLNILHISRSQETYKHTLNAYNPIYSWTSKCCMFSTTLCLKNSKPKLTKALFANFQISKNLPKRKIAPSKQISYFWKSFVFMYVYK